MVKVLFKWSTFYFIIHNQSEKQSPKLKTDKKNSLIFQIKESLMFYKGCLNDMADAVQNAGVHGKKEVKIV